MSYYHDINQNFTPYVNINISSFTVDEPIKFLSFRGSLGIDFPLFSQANLLVGYYAEIYKDENIRKAFYKNNVFHGPEFGINFKF